MSEFEIRKPISIWNKELKVDFKSLFKNLTKGVVHGVGGKWDDVAIDLSEVAASLGLQKDKAAELAWLLIWRALQQVIIELAKDYFQGHGAKVPDSIDTLVDRLDLSLEQAELTLTSRFFDRPDELPIIKLLQAPLSQWLQGCGVPRGEADAVAARLPSYFVLAVIAEWRQRASDYQIIREALQSSPFRDLESQELAWKHYTAVLARQVDEPVFGAAFGLRQIYVPLRTWYAERREEKSERPEEIPFGREKMVRVVVPLEEALRQWLHKEKRTDAIRIVSGDPGSGKSTSVKLFAWEVSSQLGRRVLFIPLHWFDVKGDLSAAVARYARNAARLPRDPLDPEKGETKLLLVFDDLDELASQGTVGYQAARDFVEALQDAVRAWNEGGLRVQVLLSGRTLVINELENRFRQPGQILHLIPYFEKKTDQYEDPAHLLATDQRQPWWQQYGRLTGKPYQALPSQLIRRELDEVTAQPLLNYLVAIVLDQGIQITQKTNLNSVYQHLISGIFKRPWAEEQHPALRGFKDEHEFFTVLEEIAVAIWQGSGRATTRSEILARCQGGTLEQSLRKLESAAQEGVTRLLTAFYFRRAEGVQGAEPAFEFSHKSFGEYLVARRLVRQVKITVGERARHQESGYFGWSEEESLRQWIELCGPKAVDPDLFRFVEREIVLEHGAGPDQVIQWQKMLDELLEWELRSGMPMQVVSGPKTFKEQTLWARNAEEALFALGYACAYNTRERRHIGWPERTSLGALVKRLQGQRDGPENTLALSCLGFLDAEGQLLSIGDFYQARFFNANLGGAALWGASLVRANLVRASLVRANLVHANLLRASLREADLREADLREADLGEADLGDADLREADLREADLGGANLGGANLGGANLGGANLGDANLRDVYLRGANLRGANLVGAILWGAKNLRQAKLDSAILEWMNNLSSSPNLYIDFDDMK